MTTETMREAVARAIDPSPFRYWDGMVNFCLLLGDDDEAARRYADQTHGPEIEATLKKADAAIRTVLERLREHKLVMREGGMVIHEVRGEPNDVWQAMLDAAVRGALPEPADSGRG
jgi:hypothetical protein